jgi:hypothetical protein
VTNNEPVIAFSTNSYAEAEILKSMLESEGIKCELEGEHQASLTGILDIRGLVRAWDKDRAEKLLSRHAPRRVCFREESEMKANKKTLQGVDLPAKPAH